MHAWAHQVAEAGGPVSELIQQGEERLRQLRNGFADPEAARGMQQPGLQISCLSPSKPSSRHTLTARKCSNDHELGRLRLLTCMCPSSSK